jgi:hypothetical protein
MHRGAGAEAVPESDGFLRAGVAGDGAASAARKASS